MTTYTVTGTVSNSVGSTPFTGTFITTDTPPVITSVTVTPASAPAGTVRTIAVVATGSPPLSYHLTAPDDQTNTTGVFTVAV